MSIAERDEELALCLAQSYDRNPGYRRIDEGYVEANAPAIRSISEALLSSKGVSEFRNVLARLNQFTRHYDNHVSKNRTNE